MRLIFKDQYFTNDSYLLLSVILEAELISLKQFKYSCYIKRKIGNITYFLLLRLNFSRLSVLYILVVYVMQAKFNTVTYLTQLR